MGIKKKVGITDVDAVTGKVFGSTYDVVKTVYDNLEMLEGLVSYIDKMPANVKDTVAKYVDQELKDQITLFKLNVETILSNSKVDLESERVAAIASINSLGTSINKQLEALQTEVDTKYTEFVKYLDSTILNVKKTLDSTIDIQKRVEASQIVLTTLNEDIQKFIPIYKEVTTEYKKEVTRSENIKNSINALYNKLLPVVTSAENILDEYKAVELNYVDIRDEVIIILNNLRKTIDSIAETMKVVIRLEEALEEGKVTVQTISNKQVLIERNLVKIEEERVKVESSINKSDILIKENKALETNIKAHLTKNEATQVQIDNHALEISTKRDEVKLWNSEASKTKTEVETLKSSIDNTAEVVKQREESVSNISDKIFEMEPKLEALRPLITEASAIKVEVEQLKEDTNNIKTDTSSIKGEVVTLKEGSLQDAEVAKQERIKAEEAARLAKLSADKAEEVASGELGPLIETKLDKTELTSSYDTTDVNKVFSAVGATALHSELTGKITQTNESINTTNSKVDSIEVSISTTNTKIENDLTSVRDSITQNKTELEGKIAAHKSVEVVQVLGESEKDVISQAGVSQAFEHMETSFKEGDSQLNNTLSGKRGLMDNKFQKEGGALILGGELSTGEFKLQDSNDMLFGSFKYSVPKSPSKPTATVSRYENGAWADFNLVMSSELIADKNGVLYFGPKKPIDTLNVSDMADSVVDNDKLITTSGAIFRALGSLKTTLDLDIKNAIALIPEVDLTEYATETFVTTAINGIPKVDLSEYVKTAQMESAIANIPKVDLTPYAKTTAVNAAISTAIEGIPKVDLSPYATIINMQSSISNMKTEILAQLEVPLSKITALEEEIAALEVEIREMEGDLNA